MPPSYRNHLYILRHGESEANVKGIVVSGQEGITGFSLTDKGREQALEAGKAFPHKSTDTVLVVTSDFSRAMATAEEFCKGLPMPEGHEAVVDKRLRERFFGEFDLKDNSNYEKVWAADKTLGPDHTEHGVESVNSVLSRVLDLVKELDEHHKGKHIVLVSHGDTLQIFQTHFAGKDPQEHRSLPHLHNGEVRLVHGLQ